MRAVVDTNVLVSGLLWHGPPHALMEHARIGTLILLTSAALIDEFTDVIARTKFRKALTRSKTNPTRMLAELRRLAEIVSAPEPHASVSRDADDDAVLALAVVARPDVIVSGDAELLVLESYDGIPIVTPSQALAIIGAA